MKTQKPRRRRNVAVQRNVASAITVGDAGRATVESSKSSVRIVQRGGRAVLRDERRRSHG